MNEKLRHQRIDPVIVTSSKKGSGKRKLKKKVEEIIKTHTHTHKYIYIRAHTYKIFQIFRQLSLRAK